MTIPAVGRFASVLGAGLPLLRRDLAGGNTRLSDRMTSQHVEEIAGPDDGAPGYIAAVGAVLLVAGRALVAVGQRRQ
ncbi:hypothetical protein [Geodermatophilus sp. URMC 63]